MNWKTMAAAAAIVLFGSYVLGGLLLEEISPAYNRGDASSYYHTNKYLEGTFVTITNCIVYSSATSSTTQDLTGLGGYFTVGNTLSSSQYVWTAQGASTGTVTAVIVLPTNGYSDCGIWLTLTNSAGQAYTYPGEKRLYMRTPFK